MYEKDLATTSPSTTSERLELSPHMYTEGAFNLLFLKT